MVSGQARPEGTQSVDLGQEAARQGETTGHVRWMLRIGVALAVLGLGAVGTWYAVRSPASHSAVSTASAQPH